MKVYTKTGDDGTTGLFFAGRVPKDHPGPAAYGAVDEAVAALGLARAETVAGTELHELLVHLQRELFVVGAELATAPENRHKLQPGRHLVTVDMVADLEPIIDEVSARFEPPQEFVLPGQNRLAAALDVARTLVRRAERAAVTATHEDWIPTDSSVVPYLNRLSDLCWTLARSVEGEPMPSRGDT